MASASRSRRSSAPSANRRRGRPPAPWKGYAAGSDVSDFVGFCRDHLIQSKDRWDGLPLLLEPFQKRLMGEAMAFDAAGWPVWRSVVIVMPRKNGKTELLAAYSLFRLLADDGLPEILLAASSDKQAGRLFDACALYVRKNPTLGALCRVRDHAGEIVREDGGGRIFRMSSDPRRLHGYNPTLVVLDELAQWTTSELKRAHAALVSGSGARSAPQVFTISTAGEARDREDSILGRIIDGAVERGDVTAEPGLQVARLHEAQTIVFNYEAQTADPLDTPAMKLANPASWITEAYLRKQALNPEMSTAEVLQLHGCVWAAGAESWLPAGAWRACEDRSIVAADGEAVFLGFDGSYNRDSTALVGCLPGDTPHVFVVDAWERPDGAREDWKVDRDAVRVAVDEAMRRWDVQMLVCDPPGWHREIDEWGEQYGAVTAMFPTNRRALMSSACSRFFSAVVERRISHDGDPRLARHLANAIVKATPEGKYITKDHPDSPRKIDLAVAAVVVHDRAATHVPAYSGPLVEVF